MTDAPILQRALDYFDKAWPGAATLSKYSVINPATGKHLADLPNMGEAQANHAIESVCQTLTERASLQQRSRWLRQARNELLKVKDELSQLITLEQGKPLRESADEIEYAAGFFQFTSDHCQVLNDELAPDLVRGCHWQIHHRPAGVAALITPWNFPVAMAAKKLSAAIAAGCTVVIKPAEQTPLSTIAMMASFQAVELFHGMIKLVVGNPAEIGKAFCSHPAVRVISFTGSTEVGKLLAVQAAPHVKRLLLELGGNAPFIVFPDADLKLAVEALMTNKFRASGQTCVCANRVYVHRDVHDAFLGILMPQVRALIVGDGMDPKTDIGPLIDRNAFDKVTAHVQDALDKGAQCLSTGGSDIPPQDWGAFYRPTVLTEVQPGMRIYQEETFGPVVAISNFVDEQQVIDRANGTNYGLAAYVFTRDRARIARMTNRLNFGHIGLNTSTGPAPHVPFGGMKHSGLGREGGIEGMLEFCETQVQVSWLSLGA